eukprot:763584-Hanusia_phi.AAC.4
MECGVRESAWVGEAGILPDSSIKCAARGRRGRGGEEGTYAEKRGRHQAENPRRTQLPRTDDGRRQPGAEAAGEAQGVREVQQAVELRGQERVLGRAEERAWARAAPGRGGPE